MEICRQYHNFLGWYVKVKRAEYSANGRRSRKASKECRISVK